MGGRLLHDADHWPRLLLLLLRVCALRVCLGCVSGGLCFWGSRQGACNGCTSSTCPFSAEELDSCEADICTNLEEGQQRALSSVRVLLLDASCRPARCISWQRAMCLDILGKVDILEFYHDREVRSSSGSYPVPAVVRARKHVRVSKKVLSVMPPHPWPWLLPPLTDNHFEGVGRCTGVPVYDRRRLCAVVAGHWKRSVMTADGSERTDFGSSRQAVGGNGPRRVPGGSSGGVVSGAQGDPVRRVHCYKIQSCNLG